MERHHSYTYPAYTGAPSRYASSHATSSAFSASANPNEDWTKISDLAERRRIQNRIAQRNYRKKLKRRLEDLERRAGSSSASPEQSHQEIEEVGGDDHSQQQHQHHHHYHNPSQNQRASTNSSASPRLQSPVDFLPSDRDASLFAQSDFRHFSASPAPAFSFPESSATPGASFYSTATHLGAYQPVSMPFNDYAYQNQYLTPLPPMLPAMQPATGAKRQYLLGEDDLLNPFNMNYASLAGVDVYNSHNYAGWDAQTPPLMDEYRFDDSRDNSPSRLEFPMTPISMPDLADIPLQSIECS